MENIVRHAPSTVFYRLVEWEMNNESAISERRKEKFRSRARDGERERVC